MDYTRPIEAIIPGVQGKVLSVLAHTETELTMRGVADLAGVSPQQASVVLGRLVDLGIVVRRDVPPVALVRLARDNLATQAIMGIAELRQAAIGTLKSLAADIAPAPASLVLFGSLARGEAHSGSDVDVLAVRPAGLANDDDSWTDSLGAWADLSTTTLGNAVNLVEVAAEEIPRLLARRGQSVWRDAATEGILLAGCPLGELATAA